MSIEQLVGSATVISSLAGRFVGYPAQIRLILKTRMVSNLSISLHSIGFISCLLWTWHGFLKRDWVILCTMGLAGLATTGSMLFLLWWFRPRRAEAEHLTALLVQIAALDGEVHAREQEEVDMFCRQWSLAADWSAAHQVMSSGDRHQAAVRHLKAYLATRPPVEQLRELKDLIWLPVEADGKVTEQERRLAVSLQHLVADALAPFGLEISESYRVIVIPDAASTDSISSPAGFELATFVGQTVRICSMCLTEPMARQFAAELRQSGAAALAVLESELYGEKARTGPVQVAEPLASAE